MCPTACSTGHPICSFVHDSFDIIDFQSDDQVKRWLVHTDDGFNFQGSDLLHEDTVPRVHEPTTSLSEGRHYEYIFLVNGNNKESVLRRGDMFVAQQKGSISKHSRQKSEIDSMISRACLSAAIGASTALGCAKESKIKEVIRPADLPAFLDEPEGFAPEHRCL